MKPLNYYWPSTWSRVFEGVCALTPSSHAWYSTINHLWRRFDHPFITKDK